MKKSFEIGQRVKITNGGFAGEIGEIVKIFMAGRSYGVVIEDYFCLYMHNELELVE